MAANGGSGGCSKQPDQQEGAVAVAAVGVIRVHEAEAWVDPFSQAEPSVGKRSKVDTLEWRIGAIPVSLYFPVFLFPDSTPFRILEFCASSV